MWCRVCERRGFGVEERWLERSARTSQAISSGAGLGRTGHSHNASRTY